MTPAATIETIRAMRQARHTLAEIAAATGVCPNTVAKYGDKPALWQAVLKMTREGLSRDEIAARIGSTAGSVRHMQYRLRRRGLIPSPQPLSSGGTLPERGNSAGGAAYTESPASFVAPR
jgi:hypothetical protein